MNIVKTLITVMIFSFFATGCDVLINPKPNMVVTQRSTKIVNNAGVFDFTKVEVNMSSTVVFKIENKGRKTLKLTGSPIIEIIGQDKNSFSISAQPETSLKVAVTTTFEVKFSPTESKFYEAAISIANNDPKRNPFIFTIKGRGVIIDIDVRQNTTHIENDTGLFDFGSIYLGNPGPTFTFTIENIGTTKLSLTGSPTLVEIQGYGASSFKIDQSMTKSELQPGETTTFDITFDPQTGGIKSAKILFDNSDPDENPYNFMIRGTCLSPEIQVLDPDNKDIPNIVGEYVFPDNHLNNTRQHTFTIKNLGTTNLILSGSPIIEISGTNSEAFSVVKQPEYTISPSSQTTFTIAFKPTTEKIYSATVTFANNDEDENPFIFTIRALGYATKFDFNGDGFDDILIGSRNDKVHNTNFDIAYLFLGRDDYPKSVDCSNADIVFKNNGDQDDVPVGVIVAVAGDINADGYDDILISNPSWRYSSENTGQVLIFFGKPNPQSLLNYKDADVLIEPTKNLHSFGWDVSSVGDFNNDGIDDFMVGAHLVTNLHAGSAFLFLGRQSWGSKLSSSKADMRIFGSIESDSFGISISGAGDFNGDGFDDVIIGAYHTYTGNAYIFFGKTNPTKTVYSEDADVTLSGENRGEYFGITVSKAGDFNHDGYNDVIVGAPRFDGNSRFEGCAYVYFGSQNPISTIAPLDADIRIIGNNMDSDFASCVSNAGDVNNDGFDDIIIGENVSTHHLYPKNANMYIYYGNHNPKQLLELEDADVQIDAEECSFFMFKALSCAGDFNGDRTDDFFFAYFHDKYIIYMFYGSTNLSNLMELTDRNLEIYTTDPVNLLGWTISGGN